MKVIVTVESTEKNFSAFLDDLPGCIATAGNLDQLEKSIREAIDFHLEGMREDGDDLPEVFKQEWELVFKFDAATLINIYSNVFTKSALERITGINQRQLWHYASGMRKPRAEQIRRIENGIHKLGEQLMSIKL